MSLLYNLLFNGLEPLLLRVHQEKEGKKKFLPFTLSALLVVCGIVI
jgi:hypothetical protein